MTKWIPVHSRAIIFHYLILIRTTRCLFTDVLKLSLVSRSIYPLTPPPFYFTPLFMDRSSTPRGRGRYPLGSTSPHPLFVCPKVEGQWFDSPRVQTTLNRPSHPYRGSRPRGSYAFFPGVSPVVSANLRLGEKCRPTVPGSSMVSDENNNETAEGSQDEPMNFETAEQVEKLFTGCEQGATNECICHRPPKVIMCRFCGNLLVGRIRKRCLAHPRRIYLYDLNRCPMTKCLAVPSMLLETDYPVEVFQKNEK